MEFSIGIHNLHSDSPHWSDTRKCKMSPERYCFSDLEKVISLEMLTLHKIFWNVKNDFRSIN